MPRRTHDTGAAMRPRRTTPRASAAQGAVLALILAALPMLAAISLGCGDGQVGPTPSPTPTPVPFPDLRGEYFGQAPPGRSFVPFAPTVIGNWYHGEVTVSPDGREIYWSDPRGIIFSRIEDGRWTAPAVVSFSGQGSPRGSVPYDDVPVVSPDNRKLFFTSLRPTGYASPSRENIWYAERTATGWGEPIPLPQNVNSIPSLHWQVSITNDGTVYFGANLKIYSTRFVGGTYADPQEVQGIDVSEGMTIPFVAPDETYLIFTSGGGTATYITFKDRTGRWLPPRTITPIRGTVFVTRDGRYIFSWFHWISADILQDYAPPATLRR